MLVGVGGTWCTRGHKAPDQHVGVGGTWCTRGHKAPDQHLHLPSGQCYTSTQAAREDSFASIQSGKQGLLCTNWDMRSNDIKPTTAQKALETNLDPLFYGSIAEIGAGQEVARNFFQAGGASGTVAKTLSAYDMQFSDAIYGQDDSGRYVVKSRLLRMLDKEYALVLKRVAQIRPANSRFFAFADTVSAKKYNTVSECHGWMGIRFQHQPGAEPSQVILHLRMFDSSNTGQQDALGTLGVNLIHSAFAHGCDPEALVDTLVDNLVWGRVEIDYVHFSGPAFGEVDEGQMLLRLVRSSLGPVVMIGPDGKGVLPADLLYKKHVLVLRGTFRPFTNINLDMIECGIDRFATKLGASIEDVVLLCEINIAHHVATGEGDISDLLDRVQMITELGYHVMVTSHFRYFRLAEYFGRHSKRSAGFILSVDNIRTVFEDRYYDGMEGGILEALARLFASNAMLLVYPLLMPDGEVLTADNLRIKEENKYLYRHLITNKRILSLYPDRSKLVPFDPEALAAMIASGDERWLDSVPPSVRKRLQATRHD